METIKKIIQQAVTTGSTDGIHTVIVPDLNATYHLTVSLSAIALDFGFFDAYEEEVEETTTTTTTTTAAPTETFYALDDDSGIFLDNNNDKFEWI